MKQIFGLLIFTLMFGVGLSVSADTHTEHSRATITRSSDTEDRTDRSRETGRDETSESDPTDGGIVLDVTLDNEGNVTINFDNSGQGGNANIQVIINGQVVNESGNQNTGGGNSSNDGQDGADGADGSDNSAEEEDEEPTGEETEAEVDYRTDRPEREERTSRDR